MTEREFVSDDYARVAQEIRDRYIHHESATAAKIMNDERDVILAALDIMGNETKRREWDPEGYTRQRMSHLEYKISQMEIRNDAGKINALCLDIAKQIDDIVEVGGYTHARRLELIVERVKAAILRPLTGEW